MAGGAALRPPAVLAPPATVERREHTQRGAPVQYRDTLTSEPPTRRSTIRPTAARIKRPLTLYFRKVLRTCATILTPNAGRLTRTAAGLLCSAKEPLINKPLGVGGCGRTHLAVLWPPVVLDSPGLWVCPGVSGQAAATPPPG